MGRSYLIDTNAAIDLIADQLPEAGRDFVDRVLGRDEVATSVINRMELLGFTGPEDELQVLAAFLQTIPILPLSEDVILQTIELRKLRKIKLPDAIIAATALVHKLTVISRNTKDFTKVSGLQHLDPHKL